MLDVGRRMEEDEKRRTRAAIARETEEIFARGSYEAGGRTVDVSVLLARALAGTIAYAPAEVAALIERARRGAPAARRPRVEVTGETTLAAARRLSRARVLCLNFASARNPGGGYLNGARAQEESICRGSGLYSTLISRPAYYEANRAWRDVLYTDWAIYSPDVPVIRDDAERLLDEPVLASFLTMPAPNRGAMRRPDDEAVRATLRRRIAAVLAIAAERGHERLVLGAWGCGAFRNDPRMVAELFREVLDEPAMASPLSEIVFAVFEADRDRGNRSAFEAAFAGW
jgi:uncharacterized protein (TIGR02452 family)